MGTKVFRTLLAKQSRSEDSSCVEAELAKCTNYQALTFTAACYAPRSSNLQALTMNGPAHPLRVRSLCKNVAAHHLEVLFHIVWHGFCTLLAHVTCTLLSRSARAWHLQWHFQLAID